MCLGQIKPSGHQSKTVFAQQSMKSSMMIDSVNKGVGDEHTKAPVSLVVPNLSNTDVFYC